MASISIVCVDDDPLVGEWVSRWLSKLGEFQVVGSYDRVHDAERAIMQARPHPHVVLLDLEMPGQDTVGLIGHLARAAPEVCVVMFSGSLNRNEVARCLIAGAHGFLSKGEPPSAIAAALHQVVRGQCVLSPRVCEAIETSPVRWAM